MPLSLFDSQLLDKVLVERYPEQKTFTKAEILVILNEMTKSEKYYPKGYVVRGSKYKVFKYFVRYCFYRNVANYDTMLLISGGKGCNYVEDKIRTPKGIVSFKNLNLKDQDILEVMAYDFKNGKEVCSPAQYFDTGRQRTYTLELEDGRTITTTASHKYFIRRDNKIREVRLKDAKLTDEIVTSSNGLHFEKIKGIKYSGWKNTCDLTVLKYHNFVMGNGIVTHNSGKSSMGILLAREWCSLLGINFSSKYHIAYSNAQVQERIDNLQKFSPLVCVNGTTKVFIKTPNMPFPYHVKINTLVGRTDFEILSYDTEAKQFEFIKPERCIETSKRERVYEVELYNGIILRTTQEHRFLTTTGYKKLTELRDDDEIIVYSIPCAKCGKEFTPLNYKVRFCSKTCNDTYAIKVRKESAAHQEYQRIYREAYREKQHAYGKEYRKNNKEIIKERGKIERAKYKERYVRHNKQYYAEHKEQINLQSKEWRQRNAERNRQYKNAQHKKLMATNPVYKIKRNLRRRLNLALKDQNVSKDHPLSYFLGCTILDLRQYLESKFVEGMTWENYGSKWHVDHIIPCATFNLVLSEEQKKCFHYTNLQPLWAEENYRKGTHVNH